MLAERELDVAGRQREAVLITHGGHDADLDRDVQVAHEPADDGGLLRVLPAEVGAVRADQVEQLQADRCDAAKVAGPILALEDRAEPLDVDLRLVAVRVELLHARGEEDVDACSLGELGVVHLVPWVAGKV